ncbi:MAG: flavin reductase family protein [Burkholderiales bacterium]
MSEQPGARGVDATPSFDPRDFRNALGTFATGVTIVTTIAPDGAPIGLTCNSFNSVSLSPALVLWSLSLRSPNLNKFLQAPHFAVNVLAAEQRALAERFGRSVANKFEGVRYTQGALGLPLIFDAAAHLGCRNETRYYSGDHVIFIGHVLHYSYRECAPLLFHRGCYGGFARDDPDQ